MSRWILWAGLLLGTLVGGCTGYVVGTVKHMFPFQQRYPFLGKRLRLPHHVPSTEGGLSFRFAMVHDVLHERFPSHSKAWYEARNRMVLGKLESLDSTDATRWPLIDDLSVGLDRLGRPEEAVPFLREKLAQQEAAGLGGRDLYTSFANLGTMLIHAHMGRMLRGDAEASQFVDEGLSLINRSIEVNPGAHFGRERWQLSIAEFIKATGVDSSLLTRFDCIGNRLDGDIELILNRESNWMDTGYGRPNRVDFTRRSAALSSVPEFFVEGVDLEDPLLWRNLSPIRNYITNVGAEEGWQTVHVPSHRTKVPFDEPILGIIGMWRQGGGANPHFSLALGEVMLRVGQRYMAWNAYERTSMLADRYSADPAVCAFLKKHCQDRQAAIEETLRAQADASRASPAKGIKVTTDQQPITAKRLRSAFQQELQAGLNYQNAYQLYEEQEIAKNRSTDDKQFFREFDRDHPPMVTKVGFEETVLAVPREAIYEYARAETHGMVMLGFGIGAVVGSLVGRMIRWAKSSLPGDADAAKLLANQELQ